MSLRKRKWKKADGETTTVWVVDVRDANGHRERRQFETRKEAEAFRIEIESRVKAGTFRSEAAKVTVKEVAVLFLTYCEGRKDRGERMTQKNYKVMEGHVHNYICPDPKRHEGKANRGRLKDFDSGIGSVKLSHLTARSIGDFRDRLRSAGVSVVTTRKILGTLQLILSYAVANDMVGINAAQGVKVIGRRDEGAKKIVAPSKDDMRRLLSVAETDFKVKLAFACATGIRAGELHALRWHHVNFERGEVKIETRVDTYGDEDVTKTSAGMRTLPLAQQIVVMLKEWKLRTTKKKQGDLVFPSKEGTYTGHDNMVKRKFNPLFDRLAQLHAEAPEAHPEAPARFNWHALRHFAISCWIEAGLSPKTVQTFAGHSSLQVTMDRYGHLFKSEDHRQKMDGIAKNLLCEGTTTAR